MPQCKKPIQMRTLSIILIFCFCISCNKNDSKTVEKLNGSEKIDKTGNDNKIKDDSPEIKIDQNEVMKEEDILFNGKFKRYFSLTEFVNVLGKADSIKLMSELEPCSYIFENEDGSKDIDDKYLYKDGSRYENNKEKVAVDEFRFTKNNFITYRGKKLNSSTTINDLKKLFPNAIKNIKTIDVHGEGNLQVIQLREDENNVSDGHINMFMRSGKLYFIHWWFPC